MSLVDRMDVNTVWLNGWNQLPDFLTRLSPSFDYTLGGDAGGVS